MQSPTGAEELLLLEAPDEDAGLALTLMAHLARPVGAEKASGGDRDWSQLTATDLDVFILRLRQSLLGDRVVSDVRCQAEGCRERIDISFGIDAYIAHHIPTRAARRGRRWVIAPAEQPGWFKLIDVPGAGRGGTARAADADDGGLFFRLPTIADLMEVAGGAEPAQELAHRCVRPSGIPARQLRLIETAMQAIAPILSRDLQGLCPACGAAVTLHFDPRRYCLRELRDRAGFLYDDVDALARRYHWAEAQILALPRRRRMHYAEAARREGSWSQ